MTKLRGAIGNIKSITPRLGAETSRNRGPLFSVQRGKGKRGKKEKGEEKKGEEEKNGKKEKE